MSYQQPLREHVIVDTTRPAPPAVPAAVLQHLDVKAKVAQARISQGQRETQELQQQVADLTTRLAQMEPPPVTPEPISQPTAVVLPENPSAPTLSTPADTAWMVGQWRAKHWQS